VQLSVGTDEVKLGGLRQRSLLAALLLDSGRPVSTETLIERVWSDDEKPSQARGVVHTYIARLRRIMRTVTPANGVQLIRANAGYRLDTPAGSLDLHRFQAVLAQAGGVDREDEAAQLLSAALDEWQGPPLAELPSAWFTRMRVGLEQQRVAALERWADAELACGRAATVVERLYGEVVDNPLAEVLVGQLMRALYATGHASEALQLYASVAERIADELGTTPGPELRAVHLGVLQQNLPPGTAT
jgi:DNA-binding SARP family transcriptional activator